MTWNGGEHQIWVRKESRHTVNSGWESRCTSALLACGASRASQGVAGKCTVQPEKAKLVVSEPLVHSGCSSAPALFSLSSSMVPFDLLSSPCKAGILQVWDMFLITLFSLFNILSLPFSPMLSSVSAILWVSRWSGYVSHCGNWVKQLKEGRVGWANRYGLSWQRRH